MNEESRVLCKSRIDRVTVYARGAVVVRSVELPDKLGASPCVLEVDVGRPSFDPRSLRAIARGSRGVLAIDARPRNQVTDPVADLASLSREVERIERELEAVRARVQRLSARRSSLASLWIDPQLEPRRADEDGAARVRDALASSATIDVMLDDVHTQLRDEERREAVVVRALEAARIARDHASTAKDANNASTVTSVLVQLAEGAPDAVESLEIEYVVDAARWWPAYKVRLSDSAKRAHWTLDAFVAQASGEDWLNALVSLSTADLVRDATLPTLHSIRIGRAQPRARAFRPPPRGLDELFVSYDDHHGGDTGAPKSAAYGGDAEPESPTTGAYDILPLREEAEGAMDDGVVGGAPEATMAPYEQQASAPAAAISRSMGESAKMKKDAGPALQSLRMGSRRRSVADEPSPEPALEANTDGDPDDAWLEYDGLELEDPTSSREHRGKLKFATNAANERMAKARAAGRAVIEKLVAPSGAVDPRAARLAFDHQYDGASRVDVVADGALHRVSIAQGEGHSKPKFRAVPKEDAAVYREAEVQNPFASPLLSGPAEVFSDDALVARTTVAAVDRGGSIALGLGVEERIRIARNAKVLESATGLLGGATQVDHMISIELGSSLGEPVVVDVIDRVPVAKRDSEIEVTVLSSKPKAIAYAQADRGAPVDGVARWAVELAPGAKATVEFSYRITFSSKLELVGGNRRD